MSIHHLHYGDDQRIYVDSAAVNIGTNNQTSQKLWQFAQDGSLTVPGTIKNSDGSGVLSFSTNTARIDAGSWGSYIEVQEQSIFIISNTTSISSGANSWEFSPNGNIKLPSNVSTINYANGVSILSGISSNYGNTNVSNFLANGFGSNTITTTGNVTAGNINANVNGFNIGYRDIPQVVFTSNATLALSDAGKHYFSSNSANVITVPNNATVSFNIGAAITIVQQGTANLTITPGSGVTMYLSGNATSASRTLGNYGMATVMKVGTDTWFKIGRAHV